MASIFDWSVIAADNDDADTDINWMEGQFPDTVNNSARAMMMRIAQWIKDQGVLTAAGTANAITLVTTNNTITVPPAGMTVSFKAAATNTGAVTLAINGGGSKPVRKLNAGDSDAVALTASDIQAKGVYLVHFDSGANAGAGAWILINPTNQSKFTDITNNYVKKSGDTMTGALNGTSLSMSGVVSGIIQHTNNYLTIGSIGIESYGDGQVRLWWSENDKRLTIIPATAGASAEVLAGRFRINDAIDNLSSIHAAPRGYVDAESAKKVSKAGDTMTGELIAPVITSSGSVSGSLAHSVYRGYMTIGSFSSIYGNGFGRLWWSEVDKKLTVAAVSGNATIACQFFEASVQPTANNHLTRKDYVDNAVSQKLDTSGGLATDLRLATYPSLGNQAASKAYVDDRIATTVTNTRMSAESYSGSITPGNEWHAPASAVVTGLSLALGSAAIAGYYKTLQIFINGAWRNF